MNEIFSSNKNITKNAYLNWRTKQNDHFNNMNVIASGFASASLELVEKTITSGNLGHEADELIFPILFNTNHAIEVYLKTISWTINVLLKKEETYDNTHDLKRLMNSVKELTEELHTDFDFDHHYGLLNRYIDELYQTIQIPKDNGQNFVDISFSRYTLTTQKQPQFYVNKLTNVVIDLENFCNVFTDIFDKLDNLSSYYQNWIEMEHENANEINCENS